MRLRKILIMKQLMEEKLKLELGLKGVLDRKVLRDEKDLSQETKESVGKSQGSHVVNE